MRKRQLKMKHKVAAKNKHSLEHLQQYLKFVPQIEINGFT